MCNSKIKASKKEPLKSRNAFLSLFLSTLSPSSFANHRLRICQPALFFHYTSGHYNFTPLSKSLYFVT